MSKDAGLTPAGLMERTEIRRVRASSELVESRRGELGQFFTPAAVAALLASMFDPCSGRTRFLDAGAGVGSLTAATIARAAAEGWPVRFDATAVEVDEDVVPLLKETLAECGSVMPDLTAEALAVDFIEWGCAQLGAGLFDDEASARFDVAILNPPYRKLNSGSRERRLLSKVGIETTNLYAAFVALSLRMLVPGGQLVAITPRSFCNGPYFKAFRRELIQSAALRRIHVFDARDRAFRDAEVLQENVVIHLVRGADQGDVTIASSTGSGDDPVRERAVEFTTVVFPDDANAFVHIVTDDAHSTVPTRISSLARTLGELEVATSTGRVVDFRAREHLRMDPGPDTAPLLYPMHLRGGRVRWPAPGAKKPNAIIASDATRMLLLPNGNYVLVKRFSAKEERRRIVATVLQGDDLPTEVVAIENHVNVFHRRNAGLPLDLAWGIAAYLNSTIVDVFFRQFNGHTQVNATDLRSLRYPSTDQLVSLGVAAREALHDQDAIDALVDEHVPELVGP
jgi:adenine-specific DNA-methyltransferase